MRAYGLRPWKIGEDTLGCRVGADVVVLGLSAQQAVANAAANEIGLVATRAQLTDNHDRQFPAFMLVASSI